MKLNGKKSDCNSSHQLNPSTTNASTFFPQHYTEPKKICFLILKHPFPTYDSINHLLSARFIVRDAKCLLNLHCEHRERHSYKAPDKHKTLSIKLNNDWGSSTVLFTAPSIPSESQWNSLPNLNMFFLIKTFSLKGKFNI